MADYSYKFARIISTVFVPPSFAIILFTLFAFLLENEFYKISLLISVALIFGFIFPVILFLFLRKKGRLIDIDATIKEERTFPFVIMLFTYFIGLLFLIFNEINIISIAFWFCYISNTLLVILINKFWKISVHAIGASGAAAALYFVIGYPAFLFLPVAFLVGYSRIKLKCHNFNQVLAGIFLGFNSTFLQIFFIIKYFSNA